MRIPRRCDEQAQDRASEDDDAATTEPGRGDRRSVLARRPAVACARRSPRPRGALGTVALAGAALLATAAPAGARAPAPVTFASTGAQQTYVVPAGVGKVRVRAVGAGGGESTTDVAGGRGRIVEADVFVTPGQTLYVEVGGEPALKEGGWNGGAVPGFGNGYSGGGGGGASDVRTVACGTATQCALGGAAASLSSRVLVAAGGGGGGVEGAGAQGTAGGRGGDADHAGTAGVRNGSIDGGGAGGAGTSTSGGAGGSSDQARGGSGVVGTGGAGGSAGPGSGHGGGGGGGYRGGGGGGVGYLFAEAGASTTSRTGGGGAGGGASYVLPGTTRLTNVVAGPTDAPQVRLTPMEGFLSSSFTVARTGDGQGSVVSSPAGIDCGSDCSGQFPESTTVTLTASAEPGSTFDGWTGCTTTTGPTCTVTVADVNHVTAKFTPTAVLTVATDGAGAGSVSSVDPLGINCPSFNCTLQGKAGDRVTLLAGPADPNTVFAGWTGGGCTGVGSCTTTLVAGQNTVRATFLPAATLSVLATGSGTGRVTSSPAGIDCGLSCSHVFGAGTRVTLSAVPDPGSVFSGFSGAGCAGSEPTCTITVGADTAVAATFSPAPVGEDPTAPGDGSGAGGGGAIPGAGGGGTPDPGPGAPAAGTGTAPPGAAAPPVATPPVVRSGPRLTLGRARTTKAVRGRITTAVTLTCAGTSARCAASARATIRVRSRSGRLRTATAGTAKVTVARGRASVVRVALNRATRRRLAAAKRLRVRVTVSMPTAAPGARRSVAYTVTVRR